MEKKEVNFFSERISSTIRNAQFSRKVALKGLEQVAQGNALRYDMYKNFRPERA